MNSRVIEEKEYEQFFNGSMNFVKKVERWMWVCMNFLY